MGISNVVLSRQTHCIVASNKKPSDSLLCLLHGWGALSLKHPKLYIGVVASACNDVISFHNDVNIVKFRHLGDKLKKKCQKTTKIDCRKSQIK